MDMGTVADIERFIKLIKSKSIQLNDELFTVINLRNMCLNSSNHIFNRKSGDYELNIWYNLKNYPQTLQYLSLTYKSKSDLEKDLNILFF